MATYFRLLLTLTPTVRDRILADAGSMLRVENDIKVPGVQCLGLYGLQGDYDCVTIPKATDSDDDARCSLEFGVRAGAHITTLPAVPIGEFSERERPRAAAAEATIRPPQPPEPPAPTTTIHTQGMTALRTSRFREPSSTPHCGRRRGKRIAAP